jgi:hypothetical protein
MKSMVSRVILQHDNRYICEAAVGVVAKRPDQHYCCHAMHGAIKTSASPGPHYAGRNIADFIDNLAYRNPCHFPFAAYDKGLYRASLGSNFNILRQRITLTNDVGMESLWDLGFELIRHHLRGPEWLLSTWQIKTSAQRST